jgi:hypothetical protein
MTNTILISTRIAFVLLMTLMFVPPAGSTEVENVIFDRQVRVGQQELEIRGAGVLRYLRFIKAYAGALLHHARPCARNDPFRHTQTARS